MAQLIKIILLLIVSCVVRAQQELTVDCIDLTNHMQHNPAIEDYMYKVQYGSSVNICYNGTARYNITETARFIIFPHIDVWFYNSNPKESFPIVTDKRLQDDYVDNYDFHLTFSLNMTRSRFTINTLTPLTDNFVIIVYNNMRFNESAIVNIKGYNTFDSETKYLTSNNTNSVPISFGNEVKLYCQGFSDTVYVALTSTNTFDFIVLNSEVVDVHSDDYSFERTDFNAYVLTIKNLTSDGKYTCIDGESPRQEIFDVVVSISASSDLTVNSVHFGDQLITESFPYGSRVNIYCHDIPRNDVEIYVIGVQVVGNSIVLEEYIDYYEFSVINETTTVFTIKDLTPLSTPLIQCFGKKDNDPLVYYSSQFIIVDGYNLLNATTKYVRRTNLIEIIEPYGSEVTFYFWILSYQNLSIIMTDQYGNTTDILDDDYEISAEFSHQFYYTQSIFNRHVFTIKNVTEDLNDVQIEFVVDGTDVLWEIVNITGFQVYEFEPPNCFDQMGRVDSEFFSVLVCVSSQTVAEGEISYTHDVNGNVTDITDKLVDLRISDRPNVNIKQLIPRNHDITTGRVYCHVGKKLPGNYPFVRESCLFDFNAN